MLTNILEGMYIGISEMVVGVAGIVLMSEADFVLITHLSSEKEIILFDVQCNESYYWSWVCSYIHSIFGFEVLQHNVQYPIRVGS